MAVPSLIRNREQITQIKDFSGLRWGTIRPTDVDVFLEFSNRVFILIELKHVKGEFKGGQMLALERMVDAIDNPPERRAILLLGEHSARIGQDIMVADVPVIKCRWNRKWRSVNKPQNMKTAIDNFLARNL